jgi:hypothetical protein
MKEMVRIVGLFLKSVRPSVHVPSPAPPPAPEWACERKLLLQSDGCVIAQDCVVATGWAGWKTRRMDWVSSLCPDHAPLCLSLLQLWK